jgi:hypothetical protein
MGDVDMTKVLVGVPIYRSVEFKVFESFLRLAGLKSETKLQFCLISSSLIYNARQYIAEEFLKSDCDFLMFIDSDMTFHSKSIDILLAHDKEFVTAKAFKREKPYQPCFYTGIKYVDGQPMFQAPSSYDAELLPIEGAGLACALIKRSAFEKIEKPYFFPYPNLGEDLTFCLKLRKAGVELFCDTTLQFGHLSQMEVFEQDFVDAYAKLGKKE